MSSESSPDEVKEEPAGVMEVQLPIPDAVVPDELQLPVYANSVVINVTRNDVVLTFFHTSALPMRPEGEPTVYNRVVQRAVLPRSIAKRLGEILQENLGE